MDLICCRNRLIYVEPGVQRKALQTLHYALKPGGFLFLGASESVGQLTDLFEAVDKKQRIFSKKRPATAMTQLLPGTTPARSAGKGTVTWERFPRCRRSFTAISARSTKPTG